MWQVYEINTQTTSSLIDIIDIPAHMYQLSWESNPAWSHYYASGPEILQYWQRVADKYDIHKYLKCSHLVTEARWNARDAKWAVSVKNLSDRKNFEDSADAIITAVGVLNQWEWPSIPGLMDFKGKLMHTARWDEDFNVQVRFHPRLCQISMLIYFDYRERT